MTRQEALTQTHRDYIVNGKLPTGLGGPVWRKFESPCLAANLYPQEMLVRLRLGSRESRATHILQLDHRFLRDLQAAGDYAATGATQASSNLLDPVKFRELLRPELTTLASIYNLKDPNA